MQSFGSAADWVAIAVSTLVAALACAVGYGMVRQRIKDMEKARDEDRELHANEVKRLEADIDKVEVRANQALELAGDVKLIPAAIEGMGQRLGDQIGHLAEVFGLRHQHLAGKVDELQAEVRETAARRRRAKAASV